MNIKQFPLLSPKELSVLHDALHFMKMSELKRSCQILLLTYKGKKALLINRILTFIQSGRIVAIPQIPAKSKAKNYPIQPLSPTGRMLYGAYKNDLKTREFFKKLIGSYFGVWYLLVK